MKPIDILEKWSQFSQYNNQRSKWEIRSSYKNVIEHLTDENYDISEINKTIKEILAFDPTGLIAVMYLSKSLEELLKDRRISIFQAMNQIDQISDIANMYELTQAEEITVFKDGLLNQINEISYEDEQKMLGQADMEQEYEMLDEAMRSLAEELINLNIDCFKIGGQITNIENFNKEITIVDDSSDAIVLADQMPESSIGLFYITNYGRADGYFAFFIKSNGSLISFNERASEAYPNQHGNSRNARYADLKEYQLFPYDELFTFNDYDYKGYAKEHTINKDLNNILKLSKKNRTILLLAMVLLARKATEINLEEESLIFSTGLFSKNIKENSLIQSQAERLPAIKESTLIEKHKEIEKFVQDIEVTSNYKTYRKEHEARGEDVRLFIDLYGHGFKLQREDLLYFPTNKSLPSPHEKQNIKADFLASGEYMQKVLFMRAREQLAEHIKKNMAQELADSGGAQAVYEWWNKCLVNNQDRILDFCLQVYTGQYENENFNYKSEVLYGLYDYKRPRIFFKESNRNGIDIVGLNRVLNEVNDRNQFICPITGAKASYFFTFSIENYKQMEFLFEEEVPKILKGYRDAGHSPTGNSSLDLTDPMEKVGTPFELHNRNEYLQETINFRHGFSFVIGLSKTGMKKLKKTKDC